MAREAKDDVEEIQGEILSGMEARDSFARIVTACIYKVWVYMILFI